MKRLEVKFKHYLLLHPRPVYVIGSGVYGKEANLMAASWVTPVAEEPPLVAVSVEKETKTHKLIEKYGEFTINILEQEHLDEIWLFGTKSGNKVDKIKLTKLNVKKGFKVKAPIISEAIGIIEAKVANKVDAGECALYIGEIVHAEAESEKYNEKYGWNLMKTRLLYHVSGRAFMSNGKLLFYKRSSYSP